MHLTADDGNSRSNVNKRLFAGAVLPRMAIALGAVAKNKQNGNRLQQQGKWFSQGAYSFHSCEDNYFKAAMKPGWLLSCIFEF